MSVKSASQLLINLINSTNRREKNGYIQIKIEGDWKWLHRVIAKEKMGDEIIEGFEVHHIDGDKQNNHPDNLKVLSKEEHKALHRHQKDSGSSPRQEVKDYISNRIKHIQSSDSQRRKNNQTADSYSEDDIAQLRSRIKKSRINSLLSELRNDHYGSGQFEGICTRCGGTGYLSEYSHVEAGVCFACGGS